ncbi:hypothetical protein CWB41_04330 [Methylovirgula ligni]|uniref:Uncharacterized protein n=1 Tax=Methylovirgula ligni TaxID=569860 RepID=A0A3D9Z7X6_9HYPH|nr:hypothetical protein [Methylovirgula ligni]QAY95053.1 hypothetical protein CWB41_04330 [Methylovirgula ligni]REF89669.1 hypothetical protein DES32_0905 [Methylovirgula ligni]
MNARTFFIVQAIVAIVFALGFLIIPRAVSHLYGVTADLAAILAFRYFGVALLGIGLIFWFAKDVKDAEARKAILGGAGIANQIGLVVSLWGTASGIMNGLGWTVVLLYALLAAGCFYFRDDRVLTLDSLPLGVLKRRP